MGRITTFALAGVLIGAVVYAQPAAHRAVSVATIRAEPSVFHGELVQITGSVKRQRDRSVLTTTDGTLDLVSAAPIPDGDVEIRGMLLDVGRVQRDDPRLTTLKIQATVSELYRQRWPAPGEELVVAVTSVTRQSREIAGITVAPLPPLPLEVDFSAPIEGEADVRLGTAIRIQFSRDLDAASLKGRIRISYSSSDSVERGEPQPPVVAFTTTYNPATRALEIRPSLPLERFRQVKLELLDGIVGTDGSVLRPWTLNFSTGGS
jgi:hypothetical protein